MGRKKETRRIEIELIQDIPRNSGEGVYLKGTQTKAVRQEYGGFTFCRLGEDMVLLHDEDFREMAGAEHAHPSGPDTP